MTQEQARQEAERRLIRYYFLPNQQAIRCALISINIEIKLLDGLHKNKIPYTLIIKLNDLHQIKD